MNYSISHHPKKPEVKQMWYNAALKCSLYALFTEAVSCKRNFLCIQGPLVVSKRKKGSLLAVMQRYCAEASVCTTHHIFTFSEVL